MDALSVYLREERRHPFAWGRRNDDCMLLLCGWAELVKGRDFGIGWRWLYSDEDGARALISERGGLPAVLDTAFGPRASTAPLRGDIGLFETGAGEIGMICTGGLWAARAKAGGIAMARFKPFAHWALGFEGR